MRKAAREIRVSMAGAFVMVLYPYRKTEDLYVVLYDLDLQQYTVKCLQCDAPEFSFDNEQDGGFYEHVAKHDRRRP